MLKGHIRREWVKIHCYLKRTFVSKSSLILALFFQCTMTSVVITCLYGLAFRLPITGIPKPQTSLEKQCIISYSRKACAQSDVGELLLENK